MNDQKNKFEIPKNIDRYLAILSKYYGKKGEEGLQKLIVNSKPRVEVEWTYDNLDGGTYGHALYLIMPESMYLDLVILNDKSEVQSLIRDEFNKLHHIQNEFIAEVFLEMEVTEEQDWREDSGLLLTRNKAVSNSVANRIWDKNCFRVFLSHKAEVKKETAELKDKLKVYGISCFVAHEDINPTKEWQNEIENALHTMDSFVALLTDKFHDSLWTDQEVGFAFGRGIPIIPVKFGKDPYGFIGKFQALSCTWDKAPIEIAKILIKKELMLNAYINAIQECPNFYIGNELANLLPFINKLTDNQIEKLIKAFNENAQVSNSYNFNGKLPKDNDVGLLYHLKRINPKISFKFSRGKIIKL